MSSATPVPAFQPDRVWWERLFVTIDAREADGFVAALAANAEFRFGNAPAVRGREAIRTTVAGA
jgi:hypothetical protein